MDIDSILRETFGFAAFRPHQRDIIEHIVADTGDGTLVVMPTGGGKSLLYQIPALLSNELSIVVSPLISLMKDQVDALQARGVAAACVNSSLPRAELLAVREQVVAGRLRLLYVAPERFANEKFMQVVETQPLNLLAIDEAHCISHWGSGFRPSYRLIAQAARRLRPRRIVALTATANRQTRTDICANLGMPQARVVVTGFARRDLRFGHCSLHGNAFVATRDAVLDAWDPDEGIGCGIVYMVTKKNCERLVEDLRRWQVPAHFYHAGLPDRDKAVVQERWMREGGVIVATTAFGMGIDKPDVRFVINGGLPSNIEEWYQMIGRGSRDGQGCLCHLFSDAEDLRIKQFMISTQYPEVADLMTFKSWLDRQAQAAGGSITIDATQTEMAAAAGVASSVGSGCCSFLSRLGLIEKVRPGTWTLFHQPDLQIDYDDHRCRIAEKHRELDEVRRIATSPDPLAEMCQHLEQG